MDQISCHSKVISAKRIFPGAQEKIVLAGGSASGEKDIQDIIVVGSYIEPFPASFTFRYPSPNFRHKTQPS